MKEAAVVIGASNGLGRSLAELLASKGHPLVLASRSAEELNLLANHLRIKYEVSATAIPIDLAKVDTNQAAAFVNDCFAVVPAITQVYITAGIIDDRDKGESSTLYLDQLMQVNCYGVSYMLNAFGQKLKDTDANIAVVSSIAAIRPRGANIAYSASKVALEYMVLGLRHHWSDKPLRLQIYRAGYMNTALSRGKKLKLPIAETADVAKLMYRNRSKNFGIRYVPAFWWPISLMLSWMPWFMYKKLKF